MLGVSPVCSCLLTGVMSPQLCHCESRWSMGRGIGGKPGENAGSQLGLESGYARAGLGCQLASMWGCFASGEGWRSQTTAWEPVGW